MKGKEREWIWGNIEVLRENGRNAVRMFGEQNKTTTKKKNTKAVSKANK